MFLYQFQNRGSSSTRLIKLCTILRSYFPTQYGQDWIRLSKVFAYVPLISPQCALLIFLPKNWEHFPSRYEAQLIETMGWREHQEPEVWSIILDITEILVHMISDHENYNLHVKKSIILFLCMFLFTSIGCVYYWLGDHTMNYVYKCVFTDRTFVSLTMGLILIEGKKKTDLNFHQCALCCQNDIF